PVAFGSRPLQAFEGVAERTLGGIAERLSKGGNGGLSFPQGSFGQSHSPVEQVGERRNTSHRFEAYREGSSGHCSRLGQLPQMPGPAGITVHQMQCGCDLRITQSAQPAWRYLRRGLQVRAQYLDEKQLGKLCRSKACPG